MAHVGCRRVSNCWSALLVLLLLAAQATGRKLLGEAAPTLLSSLLGRANALLPAAGTGAGGPLQPLRVPHSALSGTRGGTTSGRLEVLEDPGLIENRILWGEPAPGEDFGFVAALVSREDNATRFCAGAVLDNTTILTAAHCVVNNVTGYPIHPLSFWVEIEGVRYPPYRVLPHPRYNASALEADERDGVLEGGLHDIAAVQLAIAAEDAPVVDLPARKQRIRDGQALEVAGWGQTENSSNMSDILMFAEVDFIADVADCPIVPYKDTICAGNEETGARTCRGDSGGPLVLRDSDTGAVTVVGLVAFSSTNCTADLPFTRYTDVRKYLREIAAWRDEYNPAINVTGASGDLQAIVPL